MNLNQTEKRIISLLQQNGRMSNVELSEQVGLSESPCLRRVKQLEDAGLITGYCAIVDQRQLGLDVTGYVQVTMERQPDSATENFIHSVQQEPHIIECYAMSGAHDYMMKVVARSLDHFSELCMDHILKFPGVRHVESSLGLRQVKHSRVLPVA